MSLHIRWRELGILLASAIKLAMTDLQLDTYTLVLTICAWCRAHDRGQPIRCHALDKEVYVAASHGDGS